MTNSLLNLLKLFSFLPLFLSVCFLVFYLPGFFLLKNESKKIRGDEIITISFSLGIILFLIGYSVTALIKIPFFFLFLILIIGFIAFKRSKKEIFLPFKELCKDKVLLSLLFLGTLVEGFINFPSGFPYKDGHLYWSAQGHDGLWHVAVIESIKKRFPPDNPLYAGIKLNNYHYFSDIVLAGFSKFFPFFDVLDLYFRFFPFLISFLIGLSAYSFLTTWTKNKKIGLWGVFFSYFVGSFGYILLVIQKRGFFGGETIFWAAQGNTIIGNPPHAFGYFLIPSFLLCFFYFIKEKKTLLFIFSFLLSGFLAGFKVSAGVIICAGLLATGLFWIIFKKEVKIFILGVLVSIVNFLVFKILTNEGQSFLVFEPWWFIRTMVVAPDRLNWVDLELRRQFYLAKGGIRSVLRIIQFEGTAFLIFLFGNLGTRFIGWSEIIKNILNKKIFKEPLIMTMTAAMTVSFLIPLFFVQKGVAYNMIQFMQYFLLLFGFFAAITANQIISSIKISFLKKIFIIILVFLSIPTVIGNLWEFYGKSALAKVSYEEIEALKFLRKNSKIDSVVLTQPFDRWAFTNYPHQPWPISVWNSTAYVSAYTARKSYLADEGQVQILGIDPEERLLKIEKFFDSKTPLPQKQSFLDNEKIDFIYVRKEADKVNIETLSKLNIEKIYENKEVIIYATK